MFQINISEKIETHILCSMTVSFENHTVYEVVSKNIVDPEELRMTSQYGASTLHAVKSRLHARTPPRIHAPWHPPTRMHAHTHTHREKYVIFIAFPRQQMLPSRASVLRYTYIACLVIYFITNIKIFLFLMESSYRATETHSNPSFQQIRNFLRQKWNA